MNASRSLLGSVSVLALVLAASFMPARTALAGGKKLIEFDTMYGVDGPFLENPIIRGVEGDELPWVVREVHGKLETDGHLELHVKGLVFSNDDEVPPDLRGTNDEDFFRGEVSCLTEDGDTVVVANVTTGPFRATRRGDSTINARIALPNPCVAPIVFVVAGSEDKWFAVTGNENE